MFRTHSFFLLGAAIAGLTLGCAGPRQRPRILSSYSPAGSLQAPPLNSRTPIQVPMAAVNPRGPVVVAPTPVPMVGVPATPGIAIQPPASPPPLRVPPYPPQPEPPQPSSGQYQPPANPLEPYGSGGYAPGDPNGQPPAAGNQSNYSQPEYRSYGTSNGGYGSGSSNPYPGSATRRDLFPN